MEKVVGNVVGDVEGCFGSGGEVVQGDFCSLVPWFGSFVRPLVRSVGRSFVCASKELHKKMVEVLRRYFHRHHFREQYRHHMMR